MTTVRYFKSLAMALRQRKLSEDKITEVLRELQSHLQETGQGPEEAFGSPKEYAARFPEGDTVAAGTKAGYFSIALIMAAMAVKIFTGQFLGLPLGYPWLFIFPAGLFLLAVALIWWSIAMLLKLPEGIAEELTRHR